MKPESPRVCVISLPTPSTQLIIQGLSNIIEILSPICDPLYVISARIPDNVLPQKTRVRNIGTAMHPLDTIKPLWLSNLLQLFKIILIQVKMSLVLIRINRRFDTLVVFLAVPYLLLPILISRLTGKKVIIKTGGLYSEIAPTHHGRLISLIITAMERIGFAMATTIAVESSVELSKLGRYKNKGIASGIHFFDIKKFNSKLNLFSRNNTVGYIGRLTMQKGLLDFIDAIPIILERRDDITFLIGGDGPLFSRIESILKNKGLNDKVELTGLIPYPEIPDYLNKLKLFILPSETEGLPRAMLEAMACGTPVLSTPVGGVPDIIKDNENGFIMSDNSPVCIADNVIRAIEHPDLDKITANARRLIEKEYSFEPVVEKYRQMLLGIN